MELYYGIMLIKRITGIPGESLEPPETFRDPAATPLGPRVDGPGTPVHALRTPQAPMGTPVDHKNGHNSTDAQRQQL